MFKKQQRRKNAKKSPKTTITTTQHPNTISEDFQLNHHRHNHYDVRQSPKIYRKPQPTPSPTTTTSQPMIIYPETSTQKDMFTQSTSTTKSVDDTTLSQLATKILEKVRKKMGVEGFEDMRMLTSLKKWCSHMTSLKFSRNSIYSFFFTACLFWKTWRYYQIEKTCKDLKRQKTFHAYTSKLSKIST